MIKMKMAPIRIVFFSHSSELSGAPRCLLELLESIDRSSYTPIVVAPMNGPLIEALKEARIDFRTIKEINWLYLYCQTSNLFIRLFYLLERILLNIYLTGYSYYLIHQCKADLIYLNTIASRYAAISAKLSGLPVIWHIHEGYQNKLKRAFFYFLVRLVASKVIFTSKASESLWGFEKVKGKSVWVYNGIDLEKVEELSRSKIEIDFEKDKTSIGYIGQINPYKGINILIEAMEKVKEVFPNAICWIIGKPSPYQEKYYESLKDCVIRKELEHNIKFIDFQPNIFPLLAKIDILVIPSMYETFGRSLIEGMALAKPIVATRVGGIPEIVIDNETGILVSPDDSNQLSKALLILLSEPDLRLKLGEGGKKRVKDLFSLENYYKKIEAIIAELLEDKLKANI
jgi:glycosyltransferase involved in cell wall biosynthesis